MIIIDTIQSTCRSLKGQDTEGNNDKNNTDKNHDKDNDAHKSKVNLKNTSFRLIGERIQLCSITSEVVFFNPLTQECFYFPFVNVFFEIGNIGRVVFRQSNYYLIWYNQGSCVI